MKEKTITCFMIIGAIFILQILSFSLVEGNSDVDFCQTELAKSWIVDRNNAVKKLITDWLDRKDQNSLDQSLEKLTKYELFLATSCVPPLKISKDFYLLNIKNPAIELLPQDILKEFLKRKKINFSIRKLFAGKTFSYQEGIQ